MTAAKTRKPIKRRPFPWGFAVELRKATEADVARFPVPVYSPWVAQGGTTTMYVSEIDVNEGVSSWNLPDYLRALADRYERMRFHTPAEDAVVIVARRFTLPKIAPARNR